MKFLIFALVVHLNHRLILRASNHLKRPQFAVRLNDRVGEVSPNKPFGVEHLGSRGRGFPSKLESAAIKFLSVKILYGEMVVHDGGEKYLEGYLDFY